MSDHEAETSEATWEHNGSHSANGNDQGSIAIATDEHQDAGLDDRAKFLADLARVMQTTAASEQARNAEGTEQRRQAHLATIRAREAAEADELRELAKLDIKDIDGWSDEEIKRIKAERERRIATRREQLQHRLEEHRAIITREIEAVEAAIGAYRVRVDGFFSRISNESDPIAIAREAGNQPQFPDLEQIKPEHAPYASDRPVAVADETIVAEAVAGEALVADAVADEAIADGGEVVEATGEESQDASHEESFLVGVMDPDASSHPFETPWESGVAAEEVAAGSDEAVEGVAAEAEGEAIEAATEAVAAAEGEAEVAVAEGEGIAEGAEELEPVAAEARVVMPRSSGAGSWLRWPNSSGGNDSNR